MPKNRKHNRSRKHRRSRGGSAVRGAELSYTLSGSWPSRMSLGQGADYFKYHEGQHGGAMITPAPLSAITGSSLDPALREGAHMAGLDKAFFDIKGMKDQAGGRRSRRHRSHRSRRSRRNKSHRRHRSHRNKSHRNKNHRHRSRRNKSRGGALGYASFPQSTGMLLDKSGYQQAGLSPEWKSDVSFDMAKIRESM